MLEHADQMANAVGNFKGHGWSFQKSILLHSDGYADIADKFT